MILYRPSRPIVCKVQNYWQSILISLRVKAVEIYQMNRDIHEISWIWSNFLRMIHRGDKSNYLAPTDQYLLEKNTYMQNRKNWCLMSWLDLLRCRWICGYLQARGQQTSIKMKYYMWIVYQYLLKVKKLNVTLVYRKLISIDIWYLHNLPPQFISQRKCILCHQVKTFLSYLIFVTGRRARPVEKNLSCGEISNFCIWNMRRKLKFLHMWINFKFLHMTDVEKSEIHPHVD